MRVLVTGAAGFLGRVGVVEDALSNLIFNLEGFVQHLFVENEFLLDIEKICNFQ